MFHIGILLKSHSDNTMSPPVLNIVWIQKSPCKVTVARAYFLHKKSPARLQPDRALIQLTKSNTIEKSVLSGGTPKRTTLQGHSINSATTATIACANFARSMSTFTFIVRVVFMDLSSTGDRRQRCRLIVDRSFMAVTPYLVRAVPFAAGRNPRRRGLIAIEGLRSPSGFFR